MRFDKRFLVVVAISLGWAFLVSAAFYRITRGASSRRSSRTLKNVVVAAQTLELGAVITPDAIKLIPMPEEAFPKGGFSRLEDVVQRPVISPVLPDEPIVEGRLATRGSGGGVAPLIPPGMRAISVRVNDVVGVAGFVLPGMRVDVLVTGRPPRRDDMVTTTVLQNITVLSVGQTLQADSKSQSIKATVVTLLVSPPQAEALTLANTEAQIQLVLRNSTDHMQAQTSGWLASQLYGQPRSDPAVVSVPAPANRVAHRPSSDSRPPVSVTPTAPVGQHVTEIPADGVLVIRGNQKVIEAVETKPGSAK